LSDGGYSAIADQQLDDLEAGADVDLYDAILDACELIFQLPERARRTAPELRQPYRTHSR